MTIPANDREKNRIRQIAGLLYQASRSIRVLDSVDWPPEVKVAFFAKGAKELPQVSYQPLDPAPAIEAVVEARRAIVPVTTVDLWLDRQADTLERSARMLAAVGTSAFFDYGRQIYGEPTSPHRLFPLTSLQLAERVRDTIEQLVRIEMDIAPPEYHDAPKVARDIERAVHTHFGAAAPKVELVDKLSANALASAKAIRIRRDARFTDRDASQLLHHEAYIHCATSLNGRAQTDLPILAAGHPGTTRTQEGLAVFAEIISGSMELDRMRRLADRVFAIQMAIEGADFSRSTAIFWSGRQTPIRRSRTHGGCSGVVSFPAAPHSPRTSSTCLGCCRSALPFVPPSRPDAPMCSGCSSAASWMRWTFRPCASCTRWGFCGRRSTSRPGSVIPATCWLCSPIRTS